MGAFLGNFYQQSFSRRQYTFCCAEKFTNCSSTQRINSSEYITPHTHVVDAGRRAQIAATFKRMLLTRTVRVKDKKREKNESNRVITRCLARGASHEPHVFLKTPTVRSKRRGLFSPGRQNKAKKNGDNKRRKNKEDQQLLKDESVYDRRPVQRPQIFLQFWFCFFSKAKGKRRETPKERERLLWIG